MAISAYLYMTECLGSRIKPYSPSRVGASRQTAMDSAGHQQILFDFVGLVWFGFHIVPTLMELYLPKEQTTDQRHALKYNRES